MLRALLVLLLMGVVSSLAPQYIDPFCSLSGVPVRDPADKQAKYLRSQEQKCSMLVPSSTGQSPTVAQLHYVACGGLFTFATELFSKPALSAPLLDATSCSWRIDRAIVRITKDNLDQGSNVTPAGKSYVRAMDDSPTKNGVPGLILGMSLGGSGTSPQNLFPQSAVTQHAYLALQQTVHACLQAYPTTSATLRWDFAYRTSTSSRPYLVTVTINYTEPNGGLSACSNTIQKFDN